MRQLSPQSQFLEMQKGENKGRKGRVHILKFSLCFPAPGILNMMDLVVVVGLGDGEGDKAVRASGVLLWNGHNFDLVNSRIIACVTRAVGAVEGRKVKLTRNRGPSS